MFELLDALMITQLAHIKKDSTISYLGGDPTLSQR